MRVQFNDFRFDCDRRELTRAGEAIHLTPKAFDLLACLLERRPKPIARSDLFDHLWPESLVDTSRIHQLVQEIREVLHDHERHIIRTVYGRGYAFAGRAVTIDEEPSSQCRLVIGEEKFDLRQGENVVGRDYATNVRIDSSCVSRRHAVILVDDDKAAIADLGSHNGTFVGGRRVRAMTPLAHGDLIMFGCACASFVILPPPCETESLEEDLTHSHSELSTGFSRCL